MAGIDGANPHRIFQDSPDWHNRYLAWGPDGEWIYFAHGNDVVHSVRANDDRSICHCANLANTRRPHGHVVAGSAAKTCVKVNEPFVFSSIVSALPPLSSKVSLALLSPVTRPLIVFPAPHVTAISVTWPVPDSVPVPPSTVQISLSGCVPDG